MNRTPRVYQVYVIEILSTGQDALGLDLSPGELCLYAGQTGKELEERYFEHRTGRSYPGRVNKKHAYPFDVILSHVRGDELVDGVDLVIRPDLASAYPTTGEWETSLEIEKMAIADLRAQGHLVYGN